MDVSEAAGWFADSALEGWDGNAWVSDIAFGDFHAYDRFISEREFGSVKRIFLAPEEHKFDPTTYPVVRTVDGQVWIVESANPDYLGESTYEHSYLIVTATGSASLYSKESTPRASGAPGDLVETFQSTTWAKVSRYGGSDSDKFDDVRRTMFEITLPNGTEVSSDWLVQVGDSRYEIEEVYDVILSVRTRARRYDG